MKLKQKQLRKIRQVMREFKDGTLDRSYGGKVTNRKQAIAIALSEGNHLRKYNKHCFLNDIAEFASTNDNLSPRSNVVKNGIKSSVFVGKKLDGQTTLYTVNAVRSRQSGKLPIIERYIERDENKRYTVNNKKQKKDNKPKIKLKEIKKELKSHKVKQKPKLNNVNIINNTKLNDVKPTKLNKYLLGGGIVASGLGLAGLGYLGYKRITNEKRRNK